MMLNLWHAPVRRRLGWSALITAVTATALLAGCGSGSVFSSLAPTRMVVMCDGLADQGQVGGTRYTVNDGSVNTWVQQLASSYGVTLTAQVTGGQNWARGNARIALKPDAAGSAATLTLTEQIDAFLATNTIGKDDVVVLDAGLSDLVVQADAFKAGTLTEAQVLANVAEAGQALAALARRLVAAGGTHIVVAGAYNLGKSPYATAQGTSALLQSASLKYNEALLVAMVDLGANVLYVDAAFQYNLLANQPTSNGFANSTAAACSATGVVTPVTTASACTPATVGTAIAYDSYVFADDRYFTPAAQRSFGNLAFTKMKARW
jgi:outer membrane lipase/esterase